MVLLNDLFDKCQEHWQLHLRVRGIAHPPWRLSIFEEIELLDDGLPEKSLTVLLSLNSTSKIPNNSFKMAAVC